MQRVIAAYSIQDANQRISILNEAVVIDPSVFNGYNSLGYAYLETDQIQKAINVFSSAINAHPENKAGYFDIASGFLIR